MIAYTEAQRANAPCSLMLVGTGPTEDGIEVRVCTVHGDVQLTDRKALGLPARPLNGHRLPLDAESEYFYMEEMAS
jgi:hypothetical protein